MRLLIVSTILMLASWPHPTGSDDPSSERVVLRVAGSPIASVNSVPPDSLVMAEVPPGAAAAVLPAAATEVRPRPIAEQNPPELQPAEEVVRSVSREELCDALAAAAQANDLPVGFFARLIWQESRFVASAVSRAGAQGVAQFMPAVAAEVGLSDPFDPLQALPKSAEFLRALRREFGNLGLAAAAYNAGAGRVKSWLERQAKLPKQFRARAKLPKETQDYVTTITGHAPERWIAGAPANVDFSTPARVPCREETEADQEVQAEPQIRLAAAGEVVRLPSQHPSAGPPRARAALLKPSAARSGSRVAEVAAVRPWGVQLAGDWSEARARDTFERLRKKHPAMLGHRSPMVVRAKLAGKGATMHRVRIALATRAGAEQLCATLKSAGGPCVVLRN